MTTRKGYERPEKPEAEWLTKQIHVSGGTDFVEYQPGDGTRYAMLIVRLSPEVCPEIGCSLGSVMVTMINHDRSTMFVDPTGLLHWNYIREKLGLPVASCVTLGVCLSRFLGCQAVTWDEFLRG